VRLYYAINRLSITNPDQSVNIVRERADSTRPRVGVDMDMSFKIYPDILPGSTRRQIGPAPVHSVRDSYLSA
jgi:hypothetical protein